MMSPRVVVEGVRPGLWRLLLGGLYGCQYWGDFDGIVCG